MGALIFTLLFAIHALLTTHAETRLEEIRMPNVTGKQNDAYLCYSQRVKNPAQYLTHFKPLFTPVTHHMLLFVCDNPGSKAEVWNCGEGRNAEPVCEGKQKILFSWAMEAKEFKMPPDTSFPILRDEMPYLILQVHYKDASGFADLPNHQDDSGWQITMTDKPTKNLAGIYLFVGDGLVRALGETTIETSCSYNGDAKLHPFAFRVHAHSHGLLNFAYVRSFDRLSLIGAKSPQDDQTYYMVKNKNLTIRPGDQMVAKCIMFNEEDRDIRMGNTRRDEMCNFYMMYWVPKEQVKVIFDKSTDGCFADAIGDSVFDEDEDKLDDEFFRYNSWERPEFD